jgi:hypothetical protein
MHGGELEAGKQIARKHRFCYPDQTLTSFPLKPDARAENCHPDNSTEISRRNMLMLGL